MGKLEVSLLNPYASLQQLGPEAEGRWGGSSGKGE